MRLKVIIFKVHDFDPIRIVRNFKQAGVYTGAVLFLESGYV